MGNKIIENIKTFYFMAVAVMMYYFITQFIDLGLYITYRHAFALVLAGSAIIGFLYKPNIARGITVLKSALVYSLPLAVTTLISLFIWFINTVDVDVISRGLSSSFIFVNMFSFALAAGAFLYFFGEKGIMYNLIAILIANILMIVTIIVKYGMADYFSQLIALITSFATNTGDIIVQAEIHELAFCLGAYLIYMLYKPRKNIVFFILLALSVFCFLSAFKRIAIVAIVIALSIGYLLKFVAKFNEKTAIKLVTVLSVLVIFLLILYVAVIRSGVFEYLEQAGINTNGRAGIYKAVDKFYKFSPGFIGNGIGFLTYQLNTFIHIDVASVHNDFLQHFIDLGFWGYIIWLVSMILVRVLYFGAKGKTENAIVTFMLMLYLIVVSSTDNTMNYPLLTGVLATLMIGCNFDNNVRHTEVKIFGYISEPNKKKGSEFVL